MKSFDNFDENNPQNTIEILGSMNIKELSTELKGILARAYNNSDQATKAMEVMDTVSDNERDAKWYYRYGYSYVQLSSDPEYNTYEEIINALTMFEKSIELAKDNELVEWCMEVVDVYGDILENEKDKIPLVNQYYKKYIEDIMEKCSDKAGSGKTYVKITLEDIERMEEIWDILDPIYWTIDIYSSYEEYLNSAKDFTLEQRYLNAISWYFMEVNNGGHFQFFDNSTGIVWEDALNGLKEFGMEELADNFKKIVELFGGKIPFDREERWEAMDKMSEDFEELLDKADSVVYDLYDYNYTFEMKYIKSHPEKFVFEGYYNKIV